MPVEVWESVGAYVRESVRVCVSGVPIPYPVPPTPPGREAGHGDAGGERTEHRGDRRPPPDAAHRPRLRRARARRHRRPARPLGTRGARLARPARTHWGRAGADARPGGAGGGAGELGGGRAGAARGRGRGAHGGDTQPAGRRLHSAEGELWLPRRTRSYRGHSHTHWYPVSGQLCHLLRLAGCVTLIFDENYYTLGKMVAVGCDVRCTPLPLPFPPPPCFRPSMTRCWVGRRSCLLWCELSSPPSPLPSTSLFQTVHDEVLGREEELSAVMWAVLPSPSPSLHLPVSDRPWRGAGSGGGAVCYPAGWWAAGARRSDRLWPVADRSPRGPPQRLDRHEAGGGHPLHPLPHGQRLQRHCRRYPTATMHTMLIGSLLGRLTDSQIAVVIELAKILRNLRFWWCRFSPMATGWPVMRF